MSVIFSTFNVKGLQDDLKRRATFNYLRDKKHQVYLLQEVHCGPDQSKIWKNEWGGQAFFSELSRSSVGVGILLSNDIDIKIENTEIDPNGRFILIDCSLSDRKITICNIYGPNNDDPKFFELIKLKLLELGNDEIIMGGDYNITQDPHLDKKGGNLNIRHKQALTVLNEIKEEQDLIDPYRIIYPDKTEYTWRQSKPLIQCRLDFFLTSISLFGNIDKIKIIPGFKSDHSIVTMQIEFHNQPRGKGFWKFNHSLIKDIEYVKIIKEVIKEIDREELEPQIKWEMVKLTCRSKTMEYSGAKRRRDNKTINDLERKIQDYESKLNIDNSEETNQQLKMYKFQLESIHERKAKGCMIRSRARWIDQSEKSTKYFLNLEKRNFKQKHIIKLESEDKVITNPNEILNEELKFYENLYKAKINPETIDNDDVIFPQHNNHPKLSNEDKLSLEGEITEEECLNAIKAMPNNKSPGTDGFTPEFYKFFWIDIKNLLVNSINAAYLNGKMSIEQRRGIISLIPKKDKNIWRLGNWRPITLLNTDYKIATKCIAERFKKILANIINNDQSGFLKNRFIGENIRNIIDLIQHCDEQNISCMFLFIDFEKAFDSIEWPFLLKTMRHLNFGEGMIKWIKTFYNDTTSCVINNGHATKFFNLERGMRQGCPLSPYLFLICAEMLAHSIRDNPEITGIKINETEHKLNQYADDTVLFLDTNTENIEQVIASLGHFANTSGLKLNVNKSEAIIAGTVDDKLTEWCLKNNLRINNNGVNYLGIHVGKNMKELSNINFGTTIGKMKSVLNMWKQRDLTLLGKISIVKSLALSKLVYVTTVLGPPPTNVVNDIEKTLFDFVWNGKRDKIKRATIIGDYNQGGLRMPSYKLLQKSLKLSWIKRYLNRDDTCIWYSLLNNKLGKLGEHFWECNTHKKDVKQLVNLNNFWMSTIQAWHEIHYNENKHDNSVNGILNECIWYNNAIKSNNKLLYNDDWVTCGIIKINDIYKEGNIMSNLELQDIYGVKNNFIEYNRIIKSIPKIWKAKLRNNPDYEYEYITDSVINKIKSAEKVSKEFYPIFVLQCHVSPVKSQQKWDERVDHKIEDWESIYMIPRNCTNDTKLINFQYKLYLNAVTTNILLLKLGIKCSSLCSFCQSDIESITHIFWFCNHVQKLIGEILSWLENNITLELNMTSFLLGNVKGSPLENLVYILAKRYIYTCKIKEQKPCIIEFKRIVKYRYHIEKVIAVTHQPQGIKMFTKKWGLLSMEFE